MKRTLLKIALIAAAPLALGACAEGYTGFDVGYGGGYGYGPYGYSYPGYYPAWGYGYDPYDVWYDGYYGPYYNGFWGTDGFFWYQGGDHRWHRGDGDHFHHGDHDGDGGQWRHYTGQPIPGWGTGPRQSGTPHTFAPRTSTRSSGGSWGGGSATTSSGSFPGWGTGSHRRH